MWGIPGGPNYALAIDHDGTFLIATAHTNFRVLRLVTDDNSSHVNIISCVQRHDGLDLPVGLAVGQDGAFFVAEPRMNRVTRWVSGSVQGVLVAGGHGKGPGLHQLDSLAAVALGGDGSVFVADPGNHRVMRRTPGAAEGTIVAGGHGPGSGNHQLKNPTGVTIDLDGSLYITDYSNHRVMRWPSGAAEGTVVAGGEFSQGITHPIALVLMHAVEDLDGSPDGSGSGSVVSAMSLASLFSGGSSEPKRWLPDTLFKSINGWVKVQDLMPGMHILGPTGLALLVADRVCYPEEERTVVRLSTQSACLEVTETHRMMVRNRGGFETAPAMSLRAGDDMVITGYLV
mmetsp:Transcript_135415/g.235495  ORF Transcript_135415/g.235495 Transcript_135415/m.235495 type:complete len:343 (+) Transcript_135415:279-1307(+)